MTLLEDKKRMPRLFTFASGATEGSIQQWEAFNGVDLPAQVHCLWLAIGSGTAFESEDIYGIQPDPVTSESVDSITSFYRGKGLPSDYWVLHRGLGGLTVLATTSGMIHQIDEESFQTSRCYSDFERWYCECLRAEYATRYHLAWV